MGRERGLHSGRKERVTWVWSQGRFSWGRKRKPGRFTRSRCYGSNKMLGGGWLWKNCPEEGSYWAAFLLLLTHTVDTLQNPRPLYFPISLPGPPLPHLPRALLREAFPDQSP